MYSEAQQHRLHVLGELRQAQGDLNAWRQDALDKLQVTDATQKAESTRLQADMREVSVIKEKIRLEEQTQRLRVQEELRDERLRIQQQHDHHHEAIRRQLDEELQAERLRLQRDQEQRDVG